MEAFLRGIYSRKFVKYFNDCHVLLRQFICSVALLCKSRLALMSSRDAFLVEMISPQSELMFAGSQLSQVGFVGPLATSPSSLCMPNLNWKTMLKDSNAVHLG